MQPIQRLAVVAALAAAACAPSAPPQAGTQQPAPTGVNTSASPSPSPAQGSPTSQTVGASGPASAPTGTPVVDTALIFLTPLHIGLDVEVGGKKARFLLDSGATQTLVDAALAKRAGLKSLLSTSQAMGVGQGASGISLGGGVIDINGVEVERGMVGIMDLALLHTRIAPDVQGILGQNVFGRYAVDIDYGQKHIRLWDPANLPADVRKSAVELDLAQAALPLALVDASMGSQPFRCVLDSGAGSALYFFSGGDGTLGAQALSGLHAVDITTQAGLGGPTTMTLARGAQFGLGPWSFTGVPFQVAKDGNPIFAAYKIDAAIGPAALWGVNSRVVFDEPEGKVYVLNAPAAVGGTISHFLEDRSGLFLELDGQKTVVETVAPTSPAAKAGLKAGDVLVSWKGGAVPSLTDLSLALAGDAGTTIPLQVLHAGKGKPASITLTLADFP
jgi:hypothetical protein